MTLYRRSDGSLDYAAYAGRRKYQKRRKYSYDPTQMDSQRPPPPPVQTPRQNAWEGQPQSEATPPQPQHHAVEGRMQQFLDPNGPVGPSLWSIMFEDYSDKPPEIQQMMQAAQQGDILAVRAFLDWLQERGYHGASGMQQTFQQAMPWLQGQGEPPNLRRPSRPGGVGGNHG
jgi:hypothetical protein